MKTFSKRTAAFLTVLCLLMSLVLPATAAPSATNVVTTATGYLSASDVVYATTGGIIANWGARGEVCTFLSSYAKDFYTSGYTYAELSALSGGTASTAEDSALYAALQDLMEGSHTTYTSYGSSDSYNCKSYYLYTDCVSSDTSKVSLLYRGTLVNSQWDSGATYNQEHMWPNSKCVTDNEVGDIMHLRPANPSENSSRGNKAYGESSGYYDPGVSVRGDCARTVLYMYVRWGNTENLWGGDGVMESLNVLLKWMEEDPVDTWEMGRNDSVESITGTRNVFVDYPELAFLLFNTAVPSTMVTPSNDLVSDGPVDPNQPDDPDADAANTAVLVNDPSVLQAGDQIIIVAADCDKALSTTQNGNNRGTASVTKNGHEVVFGEDTQVITLETGAVDGTLAFCVGDSQYLYAASSSKNYLRTTSTLNGNASWSIAISDGVATILASGSNSRNCLTYNQSYDLFSCYSPSNPQLPVSIYKVQVECNHSYDAVVTAPTSTTGGYTTHTCSKCGDSYVDSYTDPVLLDTPVISKFENTANGIKISWNAVAGAGKYRVYAKTSKGWLNIGTTTGTSLVYTGAKSGLTYTFTVRCLNAEGTAFTSAYNTTGWKQTYVAQPAISKFENTASGIKISWNAVAGAGKYRVYAKTSKGWLNIGTTTGTSLVWTGAKTGLTYTFTVRALNAAGTAFVSSYHTTGWRQTYVAQPAISAFASTANGIKISWNAVAGAGKYRVYAKTSTGWLNIGTTTGTSLVWTGAKTGLTYTFTIRALNSAGTAFVSSFNTTGWRYAYMPAPVMSKLESTDNGIQLTWNAINGAAQYRVFVKTGKGWVTVGTTTGTSFLWTGAKAGYTYTFTVRCVNAANNAFTSSYNTSGWSIKYT